MRPEEIDLYPKRISKTIQLHTGDRVVLRPLRTEDREILGGYFLGLSEETKFQYAPHPFDQKTANELCDSINSAELLHFVATSKHKVTSQVLAYFILLMGVIDADRKRYAKPNRTQITKPIAQWRFR